jgi:hypothetical protein
LPGIVVARKDDEGIGVINLNKHGVINAFNQACEAGPRRALTLPDWPIGERRLVPRGVKKLAPIQCKTGFKMCLSKCSAQVRYGEGFFGISSSQAPGRGLYKLNPVDP